MRSQPFSLRLLATATLSLCGALLVSLAFVLEPLFGEGVEHDAPVTRKEARGPLVDIPGPTDLRLEEHNRLSPPLPERREGHLEIWPGPNLLREPPGSYLWPPLAPRTGEVPEKTGGPAPR